MRISRRAFIVLFLVSFGLVSCLSKPGGDIVIYGDSQHNPRAQRKLVQTILSFRPAAVFRVGDIVDNGHNPHHWKIFNDIHGPLLSTAEYFPALGNHEYDSPLYFENFPFLHHQRWYSVDRAGIHFVILDSNSMLGPESKQYEWLESDLAGAEDKAEFIIVILHHPLFDVGGHPPDEKGLKNVLLPVFERYGVSAVFSGHSHNYQRFEYNGIYFIVTGGGGAHLDRQSRTDVYLQKFSLTHHFCLLDFEDGFLRVRALDIRANKIDDFKIPARRDIPVIR